MHELHNGLPLVSISIPTYNQIQYVREAITTAVEQDYPNIQVVVGDDGSKDGTSRIVTEYAEMYPNRVTAIVGDHLGSTRNHNRVLNACKGKYIAFHAGDDVLLPGKITRQVEWLEKDERRVICTHDVEVFDSGTGKTLYLYSDIAPLKFGRGAAALVRDGNTFAAVSVMARTSALPSYGFDERLPFVGDWKLWIDCLASGGLFGYVEGVYARYRRHTSNISAQTRPTDRSFLSRQSDCLTTLALVEANYPHLVRYCRYRRARLLAEIGDWYIARAEKPSAEVYYVSSIKEYFTVMWELLPQPIQSALLARYAAIAALGERLSKIA